MNTMYVTPRPSNYFTSGLGVFNKAKRRKPKSRNVIQQGHIEQNRKAGPHKDRKKEANKRRCRQRIRTDNF
jgi:hypothetical protein